jgi:hypothetical protein
LVRGLEALEFMERPIEAPLDSGFISSELAKGIAFYCIGIERAPESVQTLLPPAHGRDVKGGEMQSLKGSDTYLRVNLWVQRRPNFQAIQVS